jgi:hypothetical protein
VKADGEAGTIPLNLEFRIRRRRSGRRQSARRKRRKRRSARLLYAPLSECSILKPEPSLHHGPLFLLLPFAPVKLTDEYQKLSKST